MNPKRIKQFRPLQKRSPKRPPPKKPSKVYCKKDITIVVSADENIEKAYDVIFEKEYFGKYPKGGKPYGFSTGISFEEWDEDNKRLCALRYQMHKAEIKRLSDIVCSGWLKQEERQSFGAQVPTPIKDIIATYAETPASIGYETQFQKYYEEQ